MMFSYQQLCVRVIVVDDHELTRYSLKLLLSEEKNIELVGLASNGQEAIDLVKQYSPHVIILDLQMPVVNGLSAAFEIKRIDPHVQIVAYSSVEDPQIEVMSQTAPIDVFCRKEAPTEKLIELINQLGQRSLSYQD